MHRGLYELYHLFDPLDCLIIDSSQIISPLGKGTGNHLDGVPHIVEDHQRIGDEKDRVIDHEVLVGLVWELLKITDHVVAEESDGPAVKTREPFDRHGTVAVQDILQQGQRISSVLLRPRLTILLDQDILTPDGEDAMRVKSQKGVAPPLFPSLHALQEEAMRLGAQLHEGRDRGLRICQDLLVDGDQVPLFGQLLKLVKGRIVHRYAASSL